ncbi:MAG: nucleotide-binding protein [Xenococcaceae cyanobacterium]
MEQRQDRLIDYYSDNCAAGKTIGSNSSNGVVRKGIDREKLIAIDNGALRFQPLIDHGWGKQGIAYGPYLRTSGLAFATLILNGHNTSQAQPIEALKRRIVTWIRGNKVELFPIRLLRWLFWKYNRQFARRLWWWMRFSPLVVKKYPIQLLDENLTVGWFSSEIPVNPLKEGNNFIIRATGPNNGELLTRVGDNILSAFRNLQNLQIYYIIILREKGAAYYAAAIPNAHGLSAYPNMRPIAIDPFNDDRSVYAAIYQSVLGQIGFRVDTRVYGTKVETIPELSDWYGTAIAADSLLGNELLGDRIPAIGSSWKIVKGSYQLTQSGAIATADESIALLNVDRPIGLIHAIVETSSLVTPLAMVWRCRDDGNFWRWILSNEGCQLQIVENNSIRSIAVSNEYYLPQNTTSSLQILDDGQEISFYFNGKLVFDNRFNDICFADANNIGIGAAAANDAQYIRYFEAHPRSIHIPTQLDLGAPWWKESKQIVISDDFVGESGNLANRTTTIGNKVWRKDLGKGKFVVTGDGRVVVTDAKTKPYPGRTFYTIDWDYENFADLQVDITPPGTSRNYGEKSRAGLIFWQDPKNYLIVNIWLNDNYKSAALSSFYHLDGGDEIFDGAWTNLGDRVTWGVKYTSRVIFDGMHYIAFIDGEPVFYRALTDIYPDASALKIDRVGIVVNWEWGDDTGSVFENFIAKV